MKRLIFVFLFILVIIPRNHGFATSDSEKYLDIKISKNLKYNNHIEIYSEDGLAIYNKNNRDYPLLSFEEKALRIIINEVGNVDLLNLDNNIIYSFNNTEDIIIGSNPTHEPKITIDNSSYRGYIRFLLKSEDIFVINHVGLEDYLYGVVPKEVPYSWPEETLKAQAVASRSFAMSIVKHRKDGYDLCDTTDCQVYGGTVGEQKTTTEAVDKTKGVYVFYDNKIIEAIYHSTSSGYTEDSKNVWGGDIPYLKAVKDEFSQSSPHNNWSMTVKLSEIENNLYSSGSNIGKIENIEIIDFLHTGRVNKVKIQGTLGEKIVSGGEFRALLGNVALKSTYFTLEGATGNNSNKTVYVMGANTSEPQIINLDNAHIISGNATVKVSRSAVNRIRGEKETNTMENKFPISGDEIIINGSGYGHGVGMSQYGAMEMGKLGYNYEEILKFYFTDVEVRAEY